MRLEGHDAGWRAIPVGGGAELAQDRLVPEMDAIEIADSDDVPVARRMRGQAAMNQHEERIRERDKALNYSVLCSANR